MTGDHVKIRNCCNPVKWLTLITNRAVIQIENKTYRYCEGIHELHYCRGLRCCINIWVPCYCPAVHPSVIGDLSPTHRILQTSKSRPHDNYIPTVKFTATYVSGDHPNIPRNLMCGSSGSSMTSALTATEICCIQTRWSSSERNWQKIV